MKILRTSNELKDSMNEILKRCGGMVYTHLRSQVQSQKYDLGVVLEPVLWCIGTIMEFGTNVAIFEKFET